MKILHWPGVALTAALWMGGVPVRAETPAAPTEATSEAGDQHLAPVVEASEYRRTRGGLRSWLPSIGGGQKPEASAKPDGSFQGTSPSSAATTSDHSRPAPAADRGPIEVPAVPSQAGHSFTPPASPAWSSTPQPGGSVPSAGGPIQQVGSTAWQPVSLAPQPSVTTAPTGSHVQPAAATGSPANPATFASQAHSPSNPQAAAIASRNAGPAATTAHHSAPFDPMGASPQLLEASRQVSAAGETVAGLGRTLFDARPRETQEGQPAPGGSPLSAYYGNVTVNYYVSPGGERKLNPVNHQEEIEGMMLPQSGPHAVPGVPPCTACGVPSCCPPLPCHRATFFAQAMYIRPGNADIVYATEQLGCDPGLATPTGPVGLIAPDAEMGFRVGFAVPLSECSSFVASYTWFQSDTNSHINATDGAVLAFNAAHPSLPANCGANSLSSSAKFDLDFELVDLAYQRDLWSSCSSVIYWSAGVRYGRLVQEFVASQDIGVASGLSTVTTDIDFDGLGVRFGIGGERWSKKTGFFLYGNGAASFLGGNYQADYVQTTQFGAGSQIGLSREDYRVTTLLEAELGIGWQSPKGHLRLTAGYMAMGWHNVLLTNAYLNEVTGGVTPDTDDFLTFDGLVAGFELRL